MTGGRVEVKLIEKSAPFRLNHHRLTRCNDRHYTVDKRAVTDGLAAGFTEEVVVLGFRENVLGIGECWRPLAIDPVCVPANVVDVQVGQQDVINIFWLFPRRSPQALAALFCRV